MFLIVVTLAFTESCGVQQPPSENEPPATLYIFNVEQAGEVTDIAIYRKFGGYALGGSYTVGDLTHVATVGGQRYVRLAAPLNAIFFAGRPYHPFFFDLRGEPDVRDLSQLEGLSSAFVSGQNYYAKVAWKSPSEKIVEFVVGAVIAGPLRRVEFPDFHFDSVSSDEGQSLMRQLKPQDLLLPPENPSGGAP